MKARMSKSRKLESYSNGVLMCYPDGSGHRFFTSNLMAKEGYIASKSENCACNVDGIDR